MLRLLVATSTAAVWGSVTRTPGECTPAPAGIRRKTQLLLYPFTYVHAETKICESNYIPTTPCDTQRVATRGCLWRRTSTANKAVQQWIPPVFQTRGVKGDQTRRCPLVSQHKPSAIVCTSLDFVRHVGRSIEKETLPSTWLRCCSTAGLGKQRTGYCCCSSCFAPAARVSTRRLTSVLLYASLLHELLMSHTGTREQRMNPGCSFDTPANFRHMPPVWSSPPPTS